MSEKKEDKTLTAGNLKGHTKIVFAFDVTGSMSACINNVRENLRKLINEMAKDIPGLKVGIIAFGDYCDGENCVKIKDLTDNLDEILDFVSTVAPTGGGDLEECYELILHLAQSLNWDGKGGAFVLIGDAGPHEIGYNNAAVAYGNLTKYATANVNDLDWQVELDKLCEDGISVFAMQCLKGHYSHFNVFWEEIAKRANTPLLLLDNFAESAVTLGAVARAAYGDKDVMRNYVDSGISFSASMTKNLTSLGYNVENKGDKK